MNSFTSAVKSIAKKYNDTSLILRIAIGLVIGAVLALLCPGATWLEELGNLFVGALKGIAPVLVFVIVTSALAQGSSKLDRRFGTVVWLYMLTTFIAATLSVITSMLFPQNLVLAEAATADVIPQGLGDVLHTLLANIVSNPLSADYERQLHWHPDVGLPVWSGDEEHRHVTAPKSSMVRYFGRRFAQSCAGSSTWHRSASWAWFSPMWPATACPSLRSMAACCCCWWVPCC